MPDLFGEIAIDVAAALGAVGEEMVADIKATLSADSDGPATAGAPPRRDTGELVDSIQFDVASEAGGESLTVSTDCPYAPFLEEGDHPFMLPAFEKWADVVTERVAKAVTR